MNDETIYPAITDESKHLRALEHAYWNVRRVLETATDDLTSPHPLWRDLNELSETCSWMEQVLDIPNPWEEPESRRLVKVQQR
jgi:hypothetical protein